MGLNVLESWQVKVPESSAASTIVVLANMSPDNQMEMLTQCAALKGVNGNATERFIIADTMDLWIEIANDRLHDVLMCRIEALQPNREGILRFADELKRDPLLALIQD
mgnify:CR=1 FL=1